MGNFLGGKSRESKHIDDEEENANKLPSLFITSILFLGLDNSGKSSIIEYMSAKYPMRSRAVISGPNVSTTLIDAFIDGYSFQAVEVSGSFKQRTTLWKENLTSREYDALVYVIDISPDESFRLHYSLELLREVLFYFQNKPVLVLLSKCDEVSPSEGDMKSGVRYMEHNFETTLLEILSQEHVLPSITSVLKCSARAGTGIREGIQWLCHAIDVSVKCLSPALVTQPFDFQAALDTLADHSLLSPSLNAPPPNSDSFVLASPLPTQDPVTYVQSLWS